jgi:hypothetical protein
MKACRVPNGGKLIRKDSTLSRIMLDFSSVYLLFGEIVADEPWRSFYPVIIDFFFYRFMSAMAGNLPDFEEATRALFANNQERLHELIRIWPEDIQKHLIRLVQEGAGARAQPGT